MKKKNQRKLKNKISLFLHKQGERKEQNKKWENKERTRRENTSQCLVHVTALVIRLGSGSSAKVIASLNRVR